MSDNSVEGAAPAQGVSPTGKEIRDGLLQRAEEFRKRTGLSFSEIGKKAVNDPAFLSQCENGRNFTINLYDRVITWMAEYQPSEPEQAAS